MTKMPKEEDYRSDSEIRHQYEVEKQLAVQLKSASQSDRMHLYSTLYDELFRRVPGHPQITRKATPEEKKRAVATQLRFLNRGLDANTVFLEVGPGDCSLAMEIAKRAKYVYAVDVSSEITSGLNMPQNFSLILSDGSSIPVPPDSVTVAYSNQLMEHLHPDDASDQLSNIWRALAPRGIYICVTPNRLTGPHDISKYFDETATGFHLKEYSISELTVLFRNAGFRTTKAYVGAKGVYLGFPVLLLVYLEKFLFLLPGKMRTSIARTMLFRKLLNVHLVAVK